MTIPRRCCDGPAPFVLVVAVALTFAFACVFALTLALAVAFAFALAFGLALVFGRAFAFACFVAAKGVGLDGRVLLGSGFFSLSFSFSLELSAWVDFPDLEPLEDTEPMLNVVFFVSATAVFFCDACRAPCDCMRWNAGRTGTCRSLLFRT